MKFEDIYVDIPVSLSASYSVIHGVSTSVLPCLL